MIDKTRARQLRDQGWTLRQIGEELGASGERIRQIVGPAPPAASACTVCSRDLPADRDLRTRYCSDACRNRAHHASLKHPCPKCGAPTRGKQCIPCLRGEQEVERNRRFDQLAALWAEGLTMEQIAEQLGTTKNALGGLMVRARAAGWDLPLRRAAQPKSANLTKRESRSQFTAALRNGTIRRSTRCEDCGSTDLIEGHHTDYSRPLYVVWLCHACHTDLHAAERRKTEAAA
jgi:hypothetical protein